MTQTENRKEAAGAELANRIFFRLYQCANMLHKTGTRALEAHGVTTQQWAVLGALSREDADAGLSVGELAQFLMVSRQNLAGVLARLERQGHVERARHASDARARLIRLTANGRALWQEALQPEIYAYYAEALDGFSINDRTDMLHFLNKLLKNFDRIDGPATASGG